PVFVPSAAARQAKEGLFFAVAASSATVYADADKSIVARLGTFEAAGVYAAAARAVSMAFTPAYSVFLAAYYRFFQHGVRGLEGTVSLAKRLAPVVCALGLLGSVAVWEVAPLAPKVLGADFDGTASGLRWLAAMPLLQALSYLGGDTLSGAG